MELTRIILEYGLLQALLLSLLILGSLYMQPRIWLQDLPSEMQKKIPPKTSREEKLSYFVLTIFLIVIIVVPIVAILDYGSAISFLQAWMITLGIYLIFNLTDLLIIDWLIVCTITPKFIRIEGVEIGVYRNYLRHLKDFFKGLVLVTIFSALMGLVSYSTVHYLLH